MGRTRRIPNGVKIGKKIDQNGTRRITEPAWCPRSGAWRPEIFFPDRNQSGGWICKKIKDLRPGISAGARGKLIGFIYSHINLKTSKNFYQSPQKRDNSRTSRSKRLAAGFTAFSHIF